jgi:hypothetical protein
MGFSVTSVSSVVKEGLSARQKDLLLINQVNVAIIRMIGLSRPMKPLKM